jgi:two-component system, OmpR family, sensor histidine kinase KdpD
MNSGAGQGQGRLTVYLGYAAGVGKTYKMIEDGQTLAREGRDVVIGYFEPHGRQDTISRTEGLEFVPRRKLTYRGCEFEEMDTDAILVRRPAVCLVDELAHTNVPGSARAKRWEDVLIVLEAGIGVLTTVNVQHIESLNDEVRAITGIAVRETVPDWVLKRADEIVLIDVPPQALLNRLRRGVVYSAEKARQATENFFKAHTLTALREMAIRQAAHEVDIRQGEQSDLGDAPLPDAADSSHPDVPMGPEKLLIHLSDNPSTAVLIRRGRRVADYLRAECYAACIVPSADLGSLDPPAREAIEKHLEFARQLRIETSVLEGRDPAATLVEFARRNGVTQIFVGKPARKRVPFFAARDFAMKVVSLAPDMQVSVVAERRY